VPDAWRLSHLAGDHDAAVTPPPRLFSGQVNSRTANDPRVASLLSRAWSAVMATVSIAEAGIDFVLQSKVALKYKV
jgi:hypothetical protein